MSMVWSVEGLVLGLWALALSALESSPLHTVIAYSYTGIAGVTLVTNLYAASRQIPIQSAVAEAYVCAVCALTLVYAMVLLDPNLHDQYFALDLDPWFGIAWFSAVWINALGMALSTPGKHALMFNHYGYHMVIALPSMLILWIYNRQDQSADVVGQTLAWAYGRHVTRALYSATLVGLWGLFVVLQATGEGLQTEAEWPRFDHMSTNGGLRYVLAFFLKLLGRAACILIPFSAALASHTTAQAYVAWVLVGVGGANAIDWLELIDKLLSMRRRQQDDFAPSAPPQPVSDPASLFLGTRLPSRLKDV